MPLSYADKQWFRELEQQCDKEKMANPNEFSALRQMICQFRVSELTVSTYSLLKQYIELLFRRYCIVRVVRKLAENAS